MANCIKCKAALPDGALFCPFCGKKQVAEKRKAAERAHGSLQRIGLSSDTTRRSLTRWKRWNGSPANRWTSDTI